MSDPVAFDPTATSPASQGEAPLDGALINLLVQALRGLADWVRQHGMDAQAWQQFQRLERAVAASGLKRLEHLLRALHGRLEHEAVGPSGNTDASAWVGAVLFFLEQGASIPAAEPLLAWLSSAARVLPIAPFELEALQTALAEPSLATLAEAPVAPASAGVVPLPDLRDIHPELLDALLEEFPEQCAELQRLAVQLPVSPAQAIPAALRILHTVKGSGHAAGVHAVAHLAHAMEQMLEGRGHTSVLINEVFQAGVDLLAEMTEYLHGGPVPGVERLAALDVRLREAARQSKLGPRPNIDASEPVASNTLRSDSPVTNLIEGRDRLRLRREQLDGLRSRVGEGLVGLAQMRELLGDLQQLQDQFNETVNALDEAIDFLGERLTSNRSNSTDGTFDPLEMQRFSEAQGIANRLNEARADTLEVRRTWLQKHSEMEALLGLEERLQTEQEQALIAIGQVAAEVLKARLERVYRQAAHSTGKQVRLELLGLKTQLDSASVEPIFDCLLHLIRNAIDHGIEPAPVRLAAGKPAQGMVRIEFSSEHERLKITCSDDGIGFDAARISDVGRARGLWRGEADVSDIEAVQQLVTQPGFTTRGRVSLTSGRGLGLDVVAARVTEQRGHLKLQSTPGLGASVILSFPGSLRSLGVTLVRIDEHLIGIPAGGIVQVQRLNTALLQPHGDHWLYRHAGLSIPVFALTPQARSIAGAASAEDEGRTLIILEHDRGYLALVVDAVLGTRGLIVQPLGPYLADTNTWLGASVLGNGGVCAVLAPWSLVERATPALAMPTTTETILATQQALGPCKILVVDDSITSRRSLCRALERAGFAVTGAVDGVDAQRQLREQGCELLVTDLEMPRVNGLELCRWVRQQADLYDLPVLMVSSRTGERHRSEAAQVGVSLYIAKPVVEQQLAEYARHFTDSFRRRRLNTLPNTGGS